MTKHRDLVREAIKAGFHEDGGTNHERWVHSDGREVWIPRHREIRESTARSIRKTLIVYALMKSNSLVTIILEN